MVDSNVLLWALGAVVAIIAWAVRVEAKVQAHERDIDRMTREGTQFRSDMRADLAEVKDALQYIRERLDGGHRR